MDNTWDSFPQWDTSQPDAGQQSGCFDQWASISRQESLKSRTDMPHQLNFDKTGRPLRPEPPKRYPSAPSSVPTRCPSLIYSPSEQAPNSIVGEIIFEGFVPKDKSVRRRTQNRASQRAYRDRQRQRLDELQSEIEDLKALCLQLENENKTLTRDYQERWNRLLADLKSELEKPADGERRESIGWMLKHAYGSGMAGDGQFSVYALGERGSREGEASS